MMATAGAASKQYTWDEIAAHTDKNSCWLAIDGGVYDVTSWLYKHPGGSKIIAHYSGQDATEPFRAFHERSTGAVRKYLNAFHIGSVAGARAESDIVKDFEALRVLANELGFFKPSYWFFALSLAHILVLDVLSYWIFAYFGVSWLSWLASVACFTTAQAQLCWLQHDFGHLSAFSSTRWNRAFHFLTAAVLKGISPNWWNHMHYQHHSKPNIIGKDPDVRLEKLFVIGETMPIEVAKSRSKAVPYDFQHHYFFAIGPPLLFPIYFQLMTFRHAITRRLYLELAAMVFFYGSIVVFFSPFLGVSGAIVFYEVCRTLESHWFTWVSQSNHIPMTIEPDDAKSWLELQLQSTCNVNKSFFNDWFTGHLNFQIEHHLFPTMPRHNLYKVAPLVRSLCQKHGVKYSVKPIGTAFLDIVRSLRKSGELWRHAYEELHGQ